MANDRDEIIYREDEGEGFVQAYVRPVISVLLSPALAAHTVPHSEIKKGTSQVNASLR